VTLDAPGKLVSDDYIHSRETIMCQIKRRSFLSSSATLLGAGALAAPHGHAQTKVSPVHHHADSVSLITETANHLLAALDDGQKAKAVMPFDDPERFRWFYTPVDRKGLTWFEMSPYQRHLGSALLAAGLSQTGYIKAVTIMSLEDVLKVMENDSGVRRNPENYHFSIFGAPSDTAVWGYRVEGHHVSQNYTIANGRVVDGPSFFGSNPAEVRQGPRKGLRVLPQEDDLGFALVNSLDDPLRKSAIVDPKAYADILTTNTRTAALQGQPSGLLAAKMKSAQFDNLRALTELYARNLPDDIAQRRIDQIDKAGRNIWFAWAGGVKPGDPHYYRVQTASFLIEFDMTQDGANHIHSVWRDLNADFGADLLKAHYDASHQGG
jgi:hypothetical protein